MVRNLRADGKEFDPADIRITKENMPELFRAISDIMARIRNAEMEGCRNENGRQ